MQIQPYLFFEGRCEEALEFYRKALGAKVEMLMRYKDSPEQAQGKQPPGDKIMSLAITVSDDAHAERLFSALSEGGKVHQPLIQTFFSSRFGMLADRFGVGWMVSVAKQTVNA